MEPSDYEERADFRVAMSDRVDRVLVHLSSDDRLVTWVTPAMLSSLGLSESDAGARAFTNLGRAMSKATVESKDIDSVQLGFVGTSLPFKAALILAPNLREVVGTVLGWPLMAVVPDRDFLYLWAARHADFVQRVGSVVVRESIQRHRIQFRPRFMRLQTRRFERLESFRREPNKSLQAKRDGRSSSASRFTLVGPACLSSGR